MAHEVAHEWWGQAVGWKNYHEQWLSEARAMLRDAARRAQRGPQVFQNLLRRWSAGPTTSALGPVSLGYRLAYLAQARRFARSSTTRALSSCTCCGGCSATMSSSARSAGSTTSTGSRRPHRRPARGVREESGRISTLLRSLDSRTGSPSLTATWKVSEDAATVAATFAQPSLRVFDFPITATVVRRRQHRGSPRVIDDASTTISWPLKGKLKKISLNRDKLTPLE